MAHQTDSRWRESKGITYMPTGSSAQPDIRRAPDSRTEDVDISTSDISSGNLVTIICPEDIPVQQEQQREPGTLSFASQGSPLLASPYDSSAVRPEEPYPLFGQNCTVLMTDVVGFNSSIRNHKDRRAIREALFDMTQSMLDGITGVRSEDRGDGMLTVVWPGIPTANVMDRLYTEMIPALEQHNNSHGNPIGFQLRAAVDVGPVSSDRLGVSGDAINDIARLLEAPSLKKAMRHSGACLGIIVTPFIYRAVIRNNQSLIGYRRVRVKVKEFDEMAWMSVSGKLVSLRRNTLTAMAC